MPLANIHLITDEHCDVSLPGRIPDFLRGIPGPVRFGAGNGTVRTGNKLNGDRLQHFSELAGQYRRENNLPDTDMLVLLSGSPDEMYWYNSKFVAGNDGIVHTCHWDRYFNFPVDPIYPVMYEITAWALRSRLFGSFAEAARYAHPNPRGCFMDLCLNDSDVTLKMRTGDICPECQKLIRDKALPISFVNQILHIWGIIGEKLSCRNTADFLNEVSPAEINFSQKEIFLPVYDAKVELMPIQMAVYAWFLKRGKSGVLLRDLTGNMLEKELLPVYLKLYRGSDIEEARRTVLNLADMNTNSMMQVISKIRKKFLDSLGSEQLAGHYFISKTNDEDVHRIHIPEHHVFWVDGDSDRVAAPWL